MLQSGSSKGILINLLFTVNKSWMYYVYALSSEIRNYIYVGLSSDLEKRIHAHNSGYERTTKPYRPFKLIYKEEFSTRVEAREREKYFKSTTGKNYLRGLLKKI